MARLGIRPDRSEWLVIHTFSLYFDAERVTLEQALTLRHLGCVLTGVKPDGGFGLFQREGQTYYETIAETVRQVEERCPELHVKEIEATPVAGPGLTIRTRLRREDVLGTDKPERFTG